MVDGSQEPGLYVALDEGPSQLLPTADGLGLSLQQAMDRSFVEVVRFASEYVRASQVLTLLDDEIRTQKTRRLVTDSISQTAGKDPAAFGQLLYATVMRFEASGVTSLLTLESDSMVTTHRVTERDYSTVADNILTLRYARVSVVKTRGSEHPWQTRRFATGPAGIRIEPAGDASSMPTRN